MYGKEASPNSRRLSDIHFSVRCKMDNNVDSGLNFLLIRSGKMEIQFFF